MDIVFPRNRGFFLELAFLVMSSGLGECDSISTTKLGGGVLVSPSDYLTNTKGSASIGVGVDGTNRTCNGALVANATNTGFVITTHCPSSFVPLYVYIGSIYFALDPRFNGRILNVTGPAIVFAGFVEVYPTTPIPPGSLAVVAKLNPANSLPPSEGEECVTYGYGDPVSALPGQFNTLPAYVTNYTYCNATYDPAPHGGPLSPNGESVVFCATVTNPDTGAAAACANADRDLVVMCKQLPDRRRSEKARVEAEDII